MPILRDISDVLLERIPNYFSCAIRIPHTMILKINPAKRGVAETVNLVCLFKKKSRGKGEKG